MGPFFYGSCCSCSGGDLPAKQAGGNNFLPCFVFILYTPSFKISVHSGVCFLLMSYSLHYKGGDAQVTQGEVGGVAFVGSRKICPLVVFVTA